jgi:DivIVA domain-containing protein
MAINERRLTGRDVLAKTFQAKTKRGFDPVEVDAYLELVAAQIDMLHGDVTRAGEGAAAAPAADTGEADALVAERDALQAQLATLATERDSLAAQNAELAAANEAMTTQQQALAAENDQLKTQLTSIAPPPPGAPSDATVTLPPPPVEVPAPPVVAPEAAVEESSDDRASEESFELVLRMARRSAEETIAEAHSRADEIVADANFTAAQISRESDRKAFEAANKVQAELAAVSEQIDTRKAELRHLDGRAAEKRVEMRELANKILALAGDAPRPLEGVEVVDLRTGTTENA